MVYLVVQSGASIQRCRSSFQEIHPNMSVDNQVTSGVYLFIEQKDSVV